MLELNKIYQGDCLEVMKQIDDKSVDMILCDLPYGVTSCSWDCEIDLDKIWSNYKRIIKANGAILLFGCEPMASKVRTSNLLEYKYDWIWNKICPSNQLNAKKQPLRLHENIMVFYKKQPCYNRQFTMKKQENIRMNCINNLNKRRDNFLYIHSNGSVYKNRYAKDYNPALCNPLSIISFQIKPTRQKFIHPTQKPVALFEYLIKTYTNEGDLVLDNCIGSGTTAIACINTNRNFVGIELEPKYVEIANERIKKCQIDKQEVKK